MSRFASVPLTLVFSMAMIGLAFNLQAPAADKPARAEERGATRIFFLRHAEEQVELLVTGDRTFAENCSDSCCVEVLNPLGQKRAELLAGWFDQRNIIGKITHVISSHKVRTAQTVQPIAARALEAGAPLVDDADTRPGDGVQQVPALVEECAPGFTGARSSLAPMIEALATLPTGSVAVVAAHSTTLYPLMESLGVDTSDPEDFPRTPADAVAGVNNLWEVRLDAQGSVTVQRHLVLDLELRRQKNQG